MELIFRTIFGNFLGTSFDASLRPLADPLVRASIEVYETLLRDLRPTPQKSHYQFNLRDLSKLFQGMLMLDHRKARLGAGNRERWREIEPSSRRNGPMAWWGRGLASCGAVACCLWPCWARTEF